MSTLEWKNHLHGGEDIIWQGGPDARFDLGVKDLIPIVFSIFFTSYAAKFILNAASSGGLNWMLGLLLFILGLTIFANAIYGRVFRRKHTWYTLTTQRAFIGTDMPFGNRSLKSFPITATTPIDFVDGALPSVMFASETIRRNDSSHEKQIGFERLTDAPEVLAHIRNIQQGAA